MSRRKAIISSLLSPPSRPPACLPVWIYCIPGDRRTSIQLNKSLPLFFLSLALVHFCCHWKRISSFSSSSSFSSYLRRNKKSCWRQEEKRTRACDLETGLTYRPSCSVCYKGLSHSTLLLLLLLFFHYVMWWPNGTRRRLLLLPGERK